MNRVVRRVLLVAPFALLLAACGRVTPMNSFDPAGPEADRILNLSIPVFIIAGIIFLLVEALIVIAVWKFRDRGDEDEPTQVHGNTKLELLWTIIPALILAGIAIPTVKAVVDLTARPDTGLQVKVIGHQWWFEFQYPNQDFTTANELVIPINTPIDLEMTSADVVHSFWVPRLAGKRDVIPGQMTYLKLQSDQIGEFWGQCAEFCGLGHANMRIRVKVVSQDDFDTWVADQQQPAVEPADGTDAATGKDLFLNKGCTACHVIEGVSDTAQTAAPNLTHIASRDVIAGASLNFTEDDLRAWLANPPAMKPGSYMPNLHLSSDDINSLIAYLETLK